MALPVQALVPFGPFLIDGKLKADQLQGATFTISSLGGICL